MNETRKQGIVLCLVGGAGFIAIAVFAYFLSDNGWRVHGFAWGIPGIPGLVGLLQLVSGVPFSELSAKWDGLAGWQRGVLGVLIVAVSFIPILAVVWLVVWLMNM